MMIAAGEPTGVAMGWEDKFGRVVGALALGGYYLYQSDQKETRQYEQKQAANYKAQTEKYDRLKSLCASSVAQRVRARASGQFQLVVEGGELSSLAGYPSGESLEHPYFEYRVYIGPPVADPPVSRYSFFPYTANCHQDGNGSLAIEIDHNQQYSSLLR